MIRRLSTYLGLLLALGMLHPAVGQPLEQPVTEYELKAAFLYNFATYVTWPPGNAAANAPLVIGVVGANELASHLEAMAAQRDVNGRSVQVRRIRSRSEFGGLDVLFVSDRYTEDADDMIAQSLNESTLTVTETSPDERLPSSIINFQVVDDKIRFDISLDAARTAGLTISSRLLQVALRVIGAAP